MTVFNYLKIGLCASVLSWSGLASAQIKAVLIYDVSQPAIEFAAGDLRAALTQKGFDVSTATTADTSKHTGPNQIILTTKDSTVVAKPTLGVDLKNEGFAIRRVQVGNDLRTWVIGNDASGAMYGGLQIADSVKFDGSLQNVGDSTHTASLAVRGIKFNVPLDARSTSYADDSTAAQFGIKDVWEMKFWTRFIDQMARSRMNSLSLWSENPFPAIVEYPNETNAQNYNFAGAHLDDVKRYAGITSPTNTDWYRAESEYQTSKNLESVFPTPMTIGKRVKHWQDVMAYAKSRGVAISIITWNIHIDGTRGAITNHNLKRDYNDPKTKSYFRESVRRLINTYPDLAAIGVTAGEHMQEDGAYKPTDQQKEQWLWDTYGLGYLDALPVGSARKLGFIHRAHEATLTDITSKFQNLPGYNDRESTLSFTYKYSQAHMHASTNPLFLGNRWVSTIPAGKKLTLEVRNDDFFNMRWGDIDFARAYLNNFRDQSTDKTEWKVDPDKKINGFLMGPDGFMWGREVISKNPTSPDRQQYIDKMWYSFKIWGHLGFDSSIPDQRFIAALTAQYPELNGQFNGQKLFTGMSKASKVYPLITRFYWGSLDYMWYPEASLSKDGYGTDAQEDIGYLSVNSFIEPKYPPMKTDQDGQAITMMSVKDFVGNVATTNRLTPLDLANNLETNAVDALAAISGLNASSNNDLRETIGDVTAMAALGRYYADKLRGAVELRRAQTTSGAVAQSHRNNAKTHLFNSSNHWKTYATEWSKLYKPQRISRIDKIVDLNALQAAVDYDYTSIQGVVNGTVTGTVTATFTQAISLLELVDANNGDTVLQALTAANNSIIEISLNNVVKGKSISVRARPDTGPKTVKFEIKSSGDPDIYRTEGGAPWALLGNSGSSFTPWNIVKGKIYTLSATGFSTSGDGSNPRTIQIKFID